MSEVGYEAPKNVDGAVALLARADGRARVLAGGTDLLLQMRAGRVEPALIVDIKNIPGMTDISEENGQFRVGAAVTGMQLLEHAAFVAMWPGVADGVNLIGSIQVRGRATLGGNLCNASPAADGVPPLIAAGSVATIVGPKGTRESPVEKVVTGPGQTSLLPGEFVASFLFPRRAQHAGDAYLRFTPRTEMDIAVVGVAVNLALDDAGVCTQARVSLGAVAERALLVPSAADALIGSRVDDAALERLAAEARGAARPIDDKRGTKEFRIKIAGVLARRAAAIALARARGDR